MLRRGLFARLGFAGVLIAIAPSLLMEGVITAVCATITV